MVGNDSANNERTLPKIDILFCSKRLYNVWMAKSYLNCNFLGRRCRYIFQDSSDNHFFSHKSTTVNGGISLTEHISSVEFDIARKGFWISCPSVTRK